MNDKAKVLTSILVAFTLLGMPSPLWAARISLMLGPPSLGQGGANPISIPPIDPIEYQFSYITDDNREFMVSVIPGLFYGQRFTLDTITIGLGAGLVISTAGVGLGVYQSVGWDSRLFWKHYRASAEYRQVIGYTAVGAEFPYAIRIGVGYEF
ncbi:MAG: hypothetical protein H7249_09900 [Chitinophagaceae bacterium]|nr:hypothetical protein [Oligoflexus sp.]